MIKFWRDKTFHYYKIPIAQEEQVQTFLRSLPRRGTSNTVAKMFWEKDMRTLELSQEDEYYCLTFSKEMRVGVSQVFPTFRYLLKFTQEQSGILIEVVVARGSSSWLNPVIFVAMPLLVGYVFESWAMVFLIWLIFLWQMYHSRKEAVKDFEKRLFEHFETIEPANSKQHIL